MVHLGDDTWHSLFPGYFDPNLTRPFDSFNVWDLHTVDNGVSSNLFPLMHPSNSSQWDVIFAHYLGADHAGHRYGPDHPAMTAKLQQMDTVIRQIINLLDDRTLLVVMGDHGMDSKGDHGGESDDEVEAAIWMYSKQKSFGRSSKEAATPPSSAKTRPVNQIDLVPTLSLLLGLPIPFNNLGSPLEEAFLGNDGNDFQNLATVNRLTAAQIQRYHQQYALVRKPDPAATAPPQRLWEAAVELWEDATSSSGKPNLEQWEELAKAFKQYHQSNLKVCKDLWARFDLVSMSQGITVLLLTLIVTLVYAKAVTGDTTSLNPALFVRGLAGLVVGALVGIALGIGVPSMGLVRTSLFFSALTSNLALIQDLFSVREKITGVLPESLWSCVCLISIILLSIGFAANSFTIWEDEIHLYLITVLGILMLFATFKLPNVKDRVAGCYQAMIFMAMLRLSSLSRLCREEQMPYCRSTFYASTTSSTAAPWHLPISYLIAFILPDAIKLYYKASQSYHGSAPFWVGIAFRGSLFLTAAFWTLETADNDGWFSDDSPLGGQMLKNVRMYLAQLVLAVAAGAGSATFVWQAPCVGIETVSPPPAASQPQASTPKGSRSNGPSSEQQPQPPQLVVHGTANLHGSHYTLLPLTILTIPLLLVQKPMGQLTLSATIVAILSLLELLHLLRKTPLPPHKLARHDDTMDVISTTLGPTILALLGHFAFFKTGHQAALASIQWDSAFVALKTVRYPWSPVLVLLNSFAGQILCAAAVPCCVLWRRPYRFTSPLASDDQSTTLASGNASGPRAADARALERRAILTAVARAYLTHVLVYAAINVATTVFAGHLRRHLMLYRVFSPRWMVGVAGMVVSEAVGVGVGILGVGRSVGAVAGVFGW